MMLHAIDLHKRVLQLATMREDGQEVLQEARMPACRDALTAYLLQWPGFRHRVVAETTGSWYWVDDLLREHGAALTLAHATKVEAITGAKVKTDHADARTLLTMLRLDMVPEAHVISPELRELRDLLRMRLRLVEKRTSTTNSIARLLEKYNRTAVDALPALAQVQAGFHQEQIALLNAQIRRLEKRIARELKPNEVVRRLRRIPGIGRLNAWTVPGDRRNRALPGGPELLLLLPCGAGLGQLGRAIEDQAFTGWQPLPEAGLQPRRGASGPALHRDRRRIPEEASQEEPAPGAGVGTQGAGADRLLRVEGRHRVRQHVSRSRVEPAEEGIRITTAVATPGKPLEVSWLFAPEPKL
jgi:hypothetical protein